MDPDRRNRQEDDARDLARRQGEMRVALASALEANIALLCELPDLYGKVNVPPTVDWLCSKPRRSTSTACSTSPVCEAVDVARGKLAAVRARWAITPARAARPWRPARADPTTRYRAARRCWPTSRPGTSQRHSRAATSRWLRSAATVRTIAPAKPAKPG